MSLKSKITSSVQKFIKDNFDSEIVEKQFNFQDTRKEFDGDLTLIVFPFVKVMKTKPENAAEQIGNHLKENLQEIVAFNVVKGFLNLSITDLFWIENFKEISANQNFAKFENNNKKVILEYCGPNTNKPLHFGHVRNMCIGFATANILQAAGYQVNKVNIYNDRGIQICKSMLGWLKYFNNQTPESSGKKGDFLVAEAYVKFETEMRKQAEPFIAKGLEKNKAILETELMKEAREMLLKWEKNDEDVRQLWQKMNNWVYDGFNQTYKRLGVDFEKNYYESTTYLLGKNFVEQGLKEEIFFKKDDGSTWVNLENEGLDEKILLRSDGTSVYLTQDLGTADERSKDYNLAKTDKMIYVVGDEQNYHFKVLKLTLQKMKKAYAEGIFHLSYGMVDLPGGAKMKTREGTSVDADELMDEVFEKAKQKTLELGKLDGMSDDEKNILFEQIGLAAIKYFILKVSPKKRMIFDPEESIALQGNTGPFIQYTFTRIKSLLKNAEIANEIVISKLEVEEKDLIMLIEKYPQKIQIAAENYDPSEIANYAYDLAKAYNKMYAEHSILNANVASKNFRILLSNTVGETLQKAMNLLGIQMPKKM